MKIRKETILVVLAVFVAGSFIASAGLLPFFGKIEANATVAQSVVVDGNEWDTSISHELEISAGCFEVYKHKLTNQACVDAPITLATSINGYGNGPDGVYVDYYLMEGWKTLTLENKDSNWDIIEDDYFAEFTYNPCCPELDWTLEGTFMPSTEYVLIYYADQPDRFASWGGAPALEITTFTSDADGTFYETGNKELDGCLPYDVDWNIGPDADYVASDGYEHGKGAKIWLVPAAVYDGVDTELNGWTPDEILFETDLIAYFDCDINPVPKYLYPYFDYETEVGTTQYTLAPGEELCLFIVYAFDVGIMPGQYGITTEVDIGSI